MPTKKEEFMLPLSDWAAHYIKPRYEERQQQSETTVVQKPLADLEQIFLEVFYGFTEIETTRDILEDMEVYLRRFPFTGTRVTKDRYLSLQVAT